MSDPFSAFESTEQTSGEDPVAAFLAREKVELEKIENNAFENDDFSAFSTNNQDDLSNGFADPFSGASQQNNINADDDDSLLNNLNSSDANSKFDNSHAAYEDFNSFSNNNDEPESNNSPYAAISQVDKLQQEPEKIKKWREEQRDRLTKKDSEEEHKKKEWKETAKKELDDWYKNRQEQLEKTHANNKINNKAAEAELMAQRDALSSGQEWDRVSKLCDFNPKANKNTKDVSRMRSILLQLKQQPIVKHAN